MRKRSNDKNTAAENLQCLGREVIKMAEQEPLTEPQTASITIERVAVQKEAQRRDLLWRIATAFFYGFSSLLIMVINKRVLTVHKFPSFQILGLGQMAATILVLGAAKWLRLVSFPALSVDTFRKIWPLPLFYIGNMIFGLGGTQKLSLPMMTVLRRFSILMTMIGEFYVLKVRPGMPVQLSVYLMIFGAIVAASNDLAFNLQGYIFVLLNDFCTAANGVTTKQKLDSKDLGKYGLLFYNSLFMVVPIVLLSIYSGDFSAAGHFEGWTNLPFVTEFCSSCLFGFVLMYSTVLCTQVNSALTTTIVGCLKNVLITYLGMFVGGDYKFSWLNFVGLNISVIGSIIYTKVTFTTKKHHTPAPPPAAGASAGAVSKKTTQTS